MSVSNKKQDVQIVKMELMNGEIELIKRALELYSFNLEYMMTDEHSNNEERQRKLAMLKCTFETVIAFQAKQVNGVSHNSETLNKFGKNILNNKNLIEFIPNIKEA